MSEESNADVMLPSEKKKSSQRIFVKDDVNSTE